MLEILLVITLSKKIGATAAAKGHSRGLYITLFVILWIFGELAGGIIGAVLGEGQSPLVYLFALGGAACGAILGFIIVNSLPDCSREDDDLELDRTGRSLRDPSWNAGHFQHGAEPMGTDSEHIQLSAQAARKARNSDTDSTGIQGR